MLGAPGAYSKHDRCHGTALNAFHSSRLPSIALCYFMFFAAASFPRLLELAGAWHGEGTSSRDPPALLHLAGSTLKGTAATDLLQHLHTIGSSRSCFDRFCPYLDPSLGESASHCDRSERPADPRQPSSAHKHWRRMVVVVPFSIVLWRRRLPHTMHQ